MISWLIVFALFFTAQVGFLLLFYRSLIKPLPQQIQAMLDRMITRQGVAEVGDAAAAIYVEEIRRLEQERLRALEDYEALKGLRLSTTDSELRKSKKRAVADLDKKIAAVMKDASNRYDDEFAPLVAGSGLLQFASKVDGIIEEHIQSRKSP